MVRAMTQPCGIKALSRTLYVPSLHKDEEFTFKVKIDTELLFQIQQLSELCARESLLFVSANLRGKPDIHHTGELILQVSKTNLWFMAPTDTVDDYVSHFIPIEGLVDTILSSKCETYFDFFGAKLLYDRGGNLPEFAEQLYEQGELPVESLPPRAQPLGAGH